MDLKHLKGKQKLRNFDKDEDQSLYNQEEIGDNEFIKGKVER